MAFICAELKVYSIKDSHIPGRYVDDELEILIDQ
jgi:hypothetical protein